MNEKQTELIWEAIRIIRNRSNDSNRSIEQRISYGSALDILLCAIEEKPESLHQFNY